MPEMTTEEVKSDIQSMERLVDRIMAGKEPELEKAILNAVNERVLTEQPKETPLEAYQRVVHGKACKKSSWASPS